MNEQQTTSPVDKEYLGSIALGIATGLVMGDRMSRTGRELTSIALLGAGLVATIPFFTRYVQRRINAPTTQKGYRKRLDSIRSAGGPAFDYEEDYALHQE